MRLPDPAVFFLSEYLDSGTLFGDKLFNPDGSAKMDPRPIVLTAWKRIALDEKQWQNTALPDTKCRPRLDRRGLG